MPDSLDKLKQNNLLNLFFNLVKIPSPSLSEDNLINFIKDFCAENEIHCEADGYKNLLIKVEATNPYKKPVALSAHMDVVGDFSPVNIKLEDSFIKTDGKRTLGADDKAGVACALILADELTHRKDLAHGGLEIVLTRDEEHGMSGIKHVDFSKIQSRYVLVLDADKLGQLLVSGASYTNGILKVTTPYGGHSGIDIHEKHRLNAAKLIAELISNIPQGVFYKDKTGTITSINLGTIIAGNIDNTVSKIITEKQKPDKSLDYFIKNSITNVINTEAQASYSIRSADIAKETELKSFIQKEIDEFNDRYDNYAHAKITFSEHLPPFEKTNDKLIETIVKKISEKIGIKFVISSFHAGAETHIYAQNTNAEGEKFSPFLLGLADVFNMHSNDEKVDYKTLLKGYELLKQFFIEFNQI